VTDVKAGFYLGDMNCPNGHSGTGQGEVEEDGYTSFEQVAHETSSGFNVPVLG
jgi:hypothetical protein